MQLVSNPFYPKLMANLCFNSSFENHLVCDFKMKGMLYFRAGLPLANVFQSQVSGVHSNLWEREERLDPDEDRHVNRNLEFAK